MKALIQWSRSKPLGYEEYDSGSMPLHLKRPDPTGLGQKPDDQPGLVHHLMVLGTVFTADHYCVRDRDDGGVDVIYWNDSAEEGQRFGAVRTFYPLAPDPDFGGAYNTKQSIDTVRHWAESGIREHLISMGFRESRIEAWSDFPMPDESETFHGLLVSNSLQQDHVFRIQVENRSWREWTEGVPGEHVRNGRLVDQRNKGLFKKNTGTQTLIAKSSTTTDNTIHSASNELEIDRDTAGASTVSEAVAALSDELTHLFTSISGVPNEATWPNGLYRWQIDVSNAGADLTFGCLTIGGSAGHFARVNSGATAHVGATWTQTQGVFSTGGLHLASRTLTPPTGSASDRFEALLVCASSAMHGNQTLTLELNEADDFIDGPWADLPVFSTPNAARTKDVQRGLKIRKDHHLARGVRLFYGLLEGAGDKFNDSSDGSGHATLNSGGNVNWQVTPQGIGKRLGDGANNHATLANPGSLHTGFTNGFTILVWMIKRGDPPAGIDGTLFHQDHSAATHTWGIEIKDGVLFLEMHARIAGATETITDDQALPDDEEHVYMGRYDPNLATNNAHLFIDAKEVQVATWSTGSFASSPDENIDLGGHSGGGAGDRRVPGDYLAAVLWDRPLSDAEIALATADPMFLLRHISIPQMVDFAVGGATLLGEAHGTSSTRAQALGSKTGAGQAKAVSSTRAQAVGSKRAAGQAKARGVSRAHAIGTRIRSGEAKARSASRAHGEAIRVRTAEAHARGVARAHGEATRARLAEAQARGIARTKGEGRATLRGQAKGRAGARSFGFSITVPLAGVAKARGVSRSKGLGRKIASGQGRAVSSTRAHAEAERIRLAEGKARSATRAKGEGRKTAAGQAHARGIARSKAIPTSKLFGEAHARSSSRAKGAGRKIAGGKALARSIARSHGEGRKTASGQGKARSSTRAHGEALRVRLAEAKALSSTRAHGEGSRTAGATAFGRGVTRAHGEGRATRAGVAKARSSTRAHGEGRATLRGQAKARGITRARGQTPLFVPPLARARGVSRAHAIGRKIARGPARARGISRALGILTRFEWKYDLFRGETRYEFSTAFIPQDVETEVYVARRNRLTPNGIRDGRVDGQAFPPFRCRFRIREPGGLWEDFDLTGVDRIIFRLTDLHDNRVVEGYGSIVGDPTDGIAEFDFIPFRDALAAGDRLGRWRVDKESNHEKPIFFPLRREIPIEVFS